MIGEKELFNIVTNNFETAADKLVEKANSLGGYDNISVILIKNN